MCFGKLQSKNKNFSIDLGDFYLLHKLDKKFLGIKSNHFPTFLDGKKKNTQTLGHKKNAFQNLLRTFYLHVTTRIMYKII